MADQAIIEQSLGQSSIFRYSEDGSVYESVMDKVHAEEQPKEGEVLDTSSRKHIMNAMPCIVNSGDVIAVSDDEGNFDVTRAMVDYVPSDEDELEITNVILAPSVVRGRQRTTVGPRKRSTSRKFGSSRREASTNAGEGTTKVVKNFDKNKAKESMKTTATMKKEKTT